MAVTVIHLRSFDDEDVMLERPYVYCGAQVDNPTMRNLLSLVTCEACLARAKKLGLLS